jgi:aspartyl-tRNA(Asn)/glutamyl-tRNA(Gln) amidotransferase subunit C
MIPYSALFLHRIDPDFSSNMALSLDDIHRIAHLARIEITPVEATEVGRKLDAIFELIGRMRAVDTTGIVPMSHAQDVVLSLREDRVTETDRRDVYQRLAPAVQDGLYLVPKVIE